MVYLVWAAAFFFAVSWTFVLLAKPHHRVKSTVVTVIYWWIGIGLCLAGLFSPWHLLWVMPLAVVVPMIAMYMELASTFSPTAPSIFIKTALVLGPSMAALIYWS